MVKEKEKKILQDYWANENIVSGSAPLYCDFAAFNTPVPRMGTDLRRKALKQRLIKAEKYNMDQSGNFVIMGNENMSAKEIKDLRDYAIRRFYFRIHYALKRLVSARSFVELKCQIKSGISVLFK